MQVSLGMKQIGKMILEMPKSIDDLRKISSEYLKNLGSGDMLIEEQIYLSYVEDHLLAKEKEVQRDVHGQATSPVNSPIRNLNEFFSKKVNKFSAVDPLLS